MKQCLHWPESNLIVCDFTTSLLPLYDDWICPSFTTEAFDFSVLLKFA